MPLLKFPELSISVDAGDCFSNFHSATGGDGSGVQAVLLSHTPEGQGVDVCVVHALPLQLLAA